MRAVRAAYVTIWQFEREADAMLFLASKVLNHDLNDEARLRLLDRLQERGVLPLIRSTRLNCYEMALAGSNHAGEMERALASLNSVEAGAPYVPGDVFCFEDHALFLIFGDAKYGTTGIRAGIVYERRTTEPLRKLDAFCQVVSLCISEAHGENNEGGNIEATQLTAWRQDQTTIHRGFMRFIARQDVDALYTFVRKETDRERVLASELLDDPGTRYFLRRTKEAYTEGYAVRLSADDSSAPSQFSVNKLVETGLLQREILVSCRATEHALFSLPSSDALAVVTISEARCTECGARVADEKIEEIITPTRLASGLLDDGAWLVNRIHSTLRALGVPETEIAVEPPMGDGEARIMVNVSGATFLLILRDGELTPAFARRAVDIKIANDAGHLVVVVTGAVHNEGRAYLVNFAKRLARGGSDFELIIAEDVNAAALELQYAFERVSQKILGEQLCDLDAGLGLSVARFLTARFSLLVRSREADATTQLPASQSPVTALQTNNSTFPLIGLALLDISDVNKSEARTPTPSSSQSS